jgi:hypothetical protein
MLVHVTLLVSAAAPITGEYLKLSDGRCCLRALQNDCASSCIDGVNGVDARVADTLVGIYRGHHVHTYMLRW